MNPDKALEWLLENGAEKEPEGDAACGAGHLQGQQEVASKMSRCLAGWSIVGTI
jgi:hypothetical protein